MHSSARQPAQKGSDNSVMDLALHASDMVLSSTQIQNPLQDQYPPAESLPQREETFLIPPPLMHFPHCRLEITTSPFPTDTGKLERVALPGALVRTLLSRFESSLQRQQRRKQEQPQPPRHQQHQQQPTQSTPAHRLPTRLRGKNKKTSRSAIHQYQQQRRRRQQPYRPVRIQPHFDDTDDWVFSRCILGDFTGFREDEAEALSAQGRLCCWASVELRPQQQQQQQPEQRRGGEERKWLNTGSSTSTNTAEESESPNDGDDGDCARGRGGEGDGEEQPKWELKFEVQRVGVRDPGSGWCECF
ncbi:hypothetical protein C7999DRAFT_39472 [Corynascus novoguineensis]|uniref:Uncharacterized protein n=1 Tax=Corynascus novoguineensis TaxID=1126955 RepID=A0AAN7CW60_9PEZI|nr:hypothetical protein C7999DRAFT_39472 [Corynascus novoguineensis]